MNKANRLYPPISELPPMALPSEVVVKPVYGLLDLMLLMDEVPARTVQSLWADKQHPLPSFKIGKRRFSLREDFHQWLSEKAERERRE